MYTVETYIIEILAALIGFSYPFIFQIIARIDDKYHSVNLVQLFKSERWFKYYQWTLCATIIVALIIPFLKTKEYNSSAVFNILSLQCFTYILLILCLCGLFKLLHLIWIYYHPQSLHKRIKYKLSIEIQRFKQNIPAIHNKIKKQRARIIFAHKSEFYISEYEIEDWKNKKQQLTRQLDNIITEQIPNNLVYICLGDILRFSIKDGDTHLYVNVSGTFYWSIMLCKQESENTIYSKIAPTFPNSIITTINNVIQECINSASINPSLSNPSDYLCLLLPNDEIFMAPSNAYACVWYNIKKFERYNQLEWIEGYWSHVSSEASLWFYRSYYDTNDEAKIEKGSKILFQYQEFHHMIFAYLLSKGRYSLILKMRRYSNSIPYSNALIPQNFVEMLKHLSSLSSYEKIGGNMLYSFDSNNGANENNIAAFWLRLYYIISLVIFPFSNIDEIDWNSVTSNKHTIKHYIEIVKSLIDYLSAIIEKNDKISLSNGYILGLEDYKKLYKELHLKEEDITKIQEKLSSILVSLERNLHTIKDNEPIDNYKVEVFKAKVIEIVNKTILSKMFPHKKILEDKNEAKTIILGQQVEDKDYFSKQPLITFINFPESLASYCITGIGYEYATALFNYTGKPIKTYIVDYSEIPLAFERLGVTSNSGHGILSLGLNIEIISGIQLKNQFYIPSDLKVINIYDTNNLPRMEINKDNYLCIEVKEDPKYKDKVVVAGKLKYYINYDAHVKYVQLKPLPLEYKGLKSQLHEIVEFEYNKESSRII